jgi:hypothetical protein
VKVFAHGARKYSPLVKPETNVTMNHPGAPIVPMKKSMTPMTYPIRLG